MLIGIDASRAVLTQKTGTEHYSEQIIYHISKLDKTNQYILFSEKAPDPGSLMANLPKNFSWRVIPFGYLWTQIRLSAEMIHWKNKLDVLFVPAHTIPLIHPKNVVTTIHDLGFEYFPALYAQKPIGPNNWLVKNVLNIGARIATLGKFGNSEYDYHRWAMRHAVSHATKIIAISKFTQKDIIDKYHADPKQIAIIYHGFDAGNLCPLSKSKHKNESKKLTEQYKPYLFYVGRVERKKNILNLLKAFVNLKKNKKIPQKLLLAGMPGLGYEEIKTYLVNLDKNIQNDIVELGYVGNNELIYYQQNADAFVFPTLFEGFGMPILESFACGVPVICSNTTACPEVAGDAAELVNPNSVKDIARGIHKVISSEKLKDELIHKGFARIKQFSWEKAAQETLDIILSCGKNK